MKKRIQLLIILCLLASLLACDKEKDSNTSTQDITLILDWVPNVNHVGFYVAMEEGYYADKGISLSIVEPPEEGAIPLLASGKGDFAIGAQEEMAAALSMEPPLPLQAVSAILAHNTSGIVSLQETNIQNPKDLENKKYATWGSLIELALVKHLVEAAGGDFDLVDIIPQPAIDPVAALYAGIDALWIFYGTDGVYFKEEDILINYLPIVELAPKLDYYTPLIIGNNDFLAANEELTKDFLEATKAGYLYAKENPKKAAEILLTYIPNGNSDILERGLVYLSDFYLDERTEEPWGFIDSQRWNYFFDFLEDEGVLEIPITADQGFTNQYIRGE